jgi:aldose 1-epimerase
MFRVLGWRGVILIGLCAIPLLAHAQYKAERNGPVVTLTDARHQTVVSIAPDQGDLVFSMKVKGQDVIYFPSPSLEAYKDRLGFAGIPLLAPWANRLDQQAFYANGKKYIFNMTLGNVRGAIPIHGFLTRTPEWQVEELKADNQSAWLTSRLDFYRHPDWMAQFPFAHTIELTQRLHDGVLEVRLKLDNLSTDPMPVAIGFHPYLQLTDSTRADWTIQISARTHYLLQPDKVPTGATEPIANAFKDPDAAPLSQYNLDDVFGDLIRNTDGRAVFSVSGKHQKVAIEFGPKFQSAVLYSPNPETIPLRPGRPQQNPNFICFEPMASITDAMNLEFEGKFHGLQYIPPGQSWQESFWIIPSGF